MPAMHRNYITPRIAYELFGVVYLPHYTKPGVFVSPGYPRQNADELTSAQLLIRGAIAVREWLRHGEDFPEDKECQQ